MSKQDPRIDKYLAGAPDFSRPILTHLRALMHKVCPDIEETLKWSHPTFMYKGIMCGMASFKNHCLLMFWKNDLLFSNDPTAKKAALANLEQLGKLTNMEELPSDKVITAYIKEAMRLNDEGIKLPKRAPKPRAELVVPEYLASALAKNKKARTTFEKFSPSHKREYVEWLAEAKRPETQQQRLATAVVWMSEGKPRNWKYMKC